MADELHIEILDDGTIKTTAGKVGAQNHQNAEAFLAWLAKETGGKVTRRHRGDAPAHHHHDHEHTHEH